MHLTSAMQQWSVWSSGAAQLGECKGKAQIPPRWHATKVSTALHSSGEDPQQLHEHKTKFHGIH